MKFEISSIQSSYNYNYIYGDAKAELIKLYPYLDGKIFEFPKDKNKFWIKINSIKDLNSLVTGCSCHVIYNFYNGEKRDELGVKVDGNIAIYDDYVE